MRKTIGRNVLYITLGVYMSDYQTTEEKLKEAQQANTGLLFLLVAVVIGFVTNATIGAIVFFGGMFVAHVLNEQKKEKQRVLDRRLSLYTMGAKITLRKIYFEASDNEIKSQVKQVAMESPFIHGWAFLDLDLSDFEFKSKCESEGQALLYLDAVKKIETDGPPFVLDESRIVGMQPKW